ncbi:MAG TPA: DUF5666 domain-containing protein [bacterium]|nr:DUF5666 domain-containing protein [bacterium]
MRILKQALPIHLLLGIVLAGILVVAGLATPAASQERRGRIEIRGQVTAIDFHNRTFHVQALRGRFAGSTWAVVVDRRTDFEVRDRDRDAYDDDYNRPGRAFRRLAVGDLVAVEGRVIDQGTILAREVEVFRRGGVGAPPYGAPPYGAPPYGVPPYGAPPVVTPPAYTIPAPVISYPTHGSVVGRNEFIISGRTVRQARVYIKVAPVMGPVALQTSDFQTDADYSGFFSAHVTPARLLTRRGMQYQITVVAESQGVQSPATTLIVQTQ